MAGMLAWRPVSTGGFLLVCNCVWTAYEMAVSPDSKRSAILQPQSRRRTLWLFINYTTSFTIRKNCVRFPTDEIVIILTECRQMNEDLDRRDRGSIQVLSSHLSAETGKSPNNPQWVKDLSYLRYEPRTSLIQVQSVTATLTRLVAIIEWLWFLCAN
jgi:hypothetical protein